MKMFKHTHRVSEPLLHRRAKSFPLGDDFMLKNQTQAFFRKGTRRSFKAARDGERVGKEAKNESSQLLKLCFLSNFLETQENIRFTCTKENDLPSPLKSSL